MGNPLLRFRVAKRFQGFSLECEASFDSGVTAVFGPSGAGKTTLLNCIAGLIAPDEGEIEVAGNLHFSSSDGKNLPPERRHFGYVFQDPALFPHMSVRDNVKYGYSLTPTDRRTTDLELLVELFQLSPLMDRRTTNLSGGERQRVALARALATSPDLLLLDEPLASLDDAFKGIILGYLKRISTDLGTPMVYVSHSISEVMALAETVLVLASGKRVAQGVPSQVLVNPDIGDLADSGTLRNFLEAQVLSIPQGDGLAELRVGDSHLEASGVNRRPGETVMVSIKAADVILSVDMPPTMTGCNVVAAVTEEIHTVGRRALVYADVGTRFVAEITSHALGDLDLRPGQPVYLVIKTNSIFVLDAPDRDTSSQM